mgnify:FL=1
MGSYDSACVCAQQIYDDANHNFIFLLSGCKCSKSCYRIFHVEKGHVDSDTGRETATTGVRIKQTHFKIENVTRIYQHIFKSIVDTITKISFEENMLF